MRVPLGSLSLSLNQQPSTNNHQPRNRGAALVELTCAIFVVTLGAFGAIQMQIHALDKTRVLQDYAIVERALSNEIEVLRALPFDALAPGEGVPFRSATPLLARLEEAVAEVEIVDQGELPGLLELRVRVTWTAEHRRRVSKELATLIARKEGT